MDKIVESGKQVINGSKYVPNKETCFVPSFHLCDFFHLPWTHTSVTSKRFGPVDSPKCIKFSLCFTKLENIMFPTKFIFQIQVLVENLK